LRLERTSYAGLEPSATQPATTEPTRVSLDEERVTVSPEGLLASRDQPAPPRAEVRWYRAVRVGTGGRLEQGASDPAPASNVVPLSRLKSPRLAVAAYLETMRAAA